MHDPDPRETAEPEEATQPDAEDDSGFGDGDHGNKSGTGE
jgi:hypothetical protein